jgi:RecB family exonuclease
MDVRIFPYGERGWKEKVRFFEDIISSKHGPPFLYDDILLIVPSSRLRRTYGRLFLDLIGKNHGASALAQPSLVTFHQFLRGLALKVNAPPLIDENSRVVLIEGIVKELISGEKGRNGTPEILAPSLSAAAAAMIEELSLAGVPSERIAALAEQSGFSGKPQVKLLIDAYDRYRRILSEKSLFDPAGLLSGLAERFDPSWLAPYSRVVIDGLHDSNDLEAGLLRKMAATGRCEFLIDSPSADGIGNAAEYHPLRLTREFCARVGLTPVGPAGDAPADDRFLAHALFSQTSFEESASKAPAGFSKDLRLLSAVNMREEVSLIAKEVKNSLKSGAAPDSVLVAFPSLDEYGPLTEEIFSDFGIPYNRALGRQLGASPVATAVISLLRAAQEDFSGPSLLRVFSSPFLKFGGDHGLAPAVDRLMRRRRITGGKEKWLKALQYHATEEDGTNILTEPLGELFTALAPFLKQDASPLSVWMERLTALLAWSGIKERVGLLKGPLNMNLQAYRKLNETIASLRAAGRLCPEYRYSFHEWLFLVRKTFLHARFQVPPEDEGGVQILGLGESAGHVWGEIYLGGLVDGKFPQRLQQNIFLPEATLETLGVRTLEKARLNAAYHFYRIILSAPKVVLTWPENEGDRPVVPSPFLAELAPLRMAGLVNRGVAKTTGIQFSLTMEESRSVPDLAKAISLAGEIRGLEKVLESDLDGIAGLRQALSYRPGDKAVPLVPPIKRRFRVTELDEYLTCPYDYYVRHVLKIEPLEEVTEDISPAGRGSKVHAILRNFYAQWRGPLTAGNRDAARRVLFSLAEEAFRHEADTFRNRREKALFLRVMAERFLDAEVEFWKQGLRPGYFELDIKSFAITLSDGTEVELHAKIDRIDVDDKGNFIIVDYKTGGYPQPRMGVEQEIFQLPVYAVMARRIGTGQDLPLRKPIGLAYYDLAGKNKGLARDVVLFDREVRDDHPVNKPRAGAKSSEEFGQMLTMSMEKARKAVEGILAGDFLVPPQDESRCRYCANDAMCENKQS